MNLKKFFDQAVTIESRRRSFQDIGASGAKLDPGNGITVSKFETGGNRRQVECFKCGQISHIAPQCRVNKAQKNGDERNKKYRNFNKHGNSQGGGDQQPRNQSGGGYNQQSYRQNGSQSYNGGRSGGKSGYGDQSQNRGNGNQQSSNYNNGKFGSNKNVGCYKCGEFGHFRAACTNKPSVKSVDMERTQNEGDMSLDLHSLQLYATSVRADYPTNEPVTTTLNMGRAGIEQFEVDTAASHSILTYEAYNRLRNMPYGSIPDLRPETKTVQLADGSSSRQKMGSVSIWCQAGNSGSEKLDFYVMKAPNNLLGRYAIESYGRMSLKD